MKKIFSLLFVLFAGMTVFAQNARITVDDVQIEAGKQSLLTIFVKNASKYRAVDMYVELPEGFTFVYDEVEKHYAHVDDDLLTKLSGFTDRLYSDILLRVAINNNSAFAKDEGFLAKIAITCSADMPAGEYEGVVKSIVFNEDRNGIFSPYYHDDVPFNIIVGPETPAEEYDITIGGTRVNNLNKGDVLGDGVFTFNPSTNMLIVKGDYSGEKAAVNSSIDNLYISFTRNSTLESSVETVITLTGTTTMTSNSGVKVTLKKSGENRSSGIYHHGAGKYFVISNMDLTVCGNNKFGIVSAATANDQSYLNISHSNIDVSASSVVLGDFRTLALASCYLTAPAGASIQNGSVVDASGNQIAGQRVVISTEQSLVISVEDITRLIDEYLTPNSSVTLGDITDLIDRYLEQ
ncbi:MAG: hypothetical protein IJ901_05185 [Bacteroidaceae bacterium]|nr:hypothetical protein [Bacteroidaceae bacterium]